MSTDICDLPLEEKLYRTRFETDPDFRHLKVDETVCRTCVDKTCLYICPAEVYSPNPNDDQVVVARYENCLECGACRVMCEPEGVHWQFPNGGMGVKYRFG